MRNREYMLIDGKNSIEYGIWLFGNEEYNFPQRDVEMVSVPGRSGDLTIDKDRFKNIKVKYSCVMLDKDGRNLDAFRAFLLSGSGYRRIETTFDLDHYRLGISTGDIKPKMSRQKDVSTFDMVFDCKPQRYFKSGEDSFSVNSGETVYNPSLYESRPLIRVVTRLKSGTTKARLTIGNVAVDVLPVADYVDIDSELQDAYHGLDNLNSKISLVNNAFPVLSAGENQITFTDITSVTITPRWWTI